MGRGDTADVPELNVLGRPLEPCGTDPVTGFFRDAEAWRVLSELAYTQPYF